ncbi:MAG: NAD-dependent malic enzyme [Solirubrobacterales bacterium]|nr:NAD-dependent malic enzyme [Solirubrobacterales bacterium]MBV9366963.1 NAD-dependent malic enzyme [Solirubrobacterales bacterium]MBV9810185.1 NAD-dependent malic enzyme [Solirubrobacterales bacterium]
MLDCTYRVQIPHHAGQLARVAQAIADGEGIIGDVVTVSLGRECSVRDITVEARDNDQAEHIAELIEALDGVGVLWHQDRALLRHMGGKLRIDACWPVRTVQEMRDVYTPGVARVCTAIAEQPELAARYTMISRSVAICTNGTRVLGLGNIGPVASMPVMEGKAVFYDQFAGISAMPVLIDAADVDTFVDTVVRIAPTFGGIHLEDISAPECFEIERRLIKALPQPVMHDDVHGTAVVSLAALMVACRYAGIELQAATVGQLGLGAAGYGIAALMVDGGVKRVLAFDPLEASHARARAHGIEISSMERVLAEADVVVATTGRSGLIQPAMIRPGQVILALTNPNPEIEPELAEAAGAAFAADGRSVNNVIGYPGIFRGALQAGAAGINVEMKLAAAQAIAGLARDRELVPNALDQSVHDAVANAVREAAISSGIARPEHATTDL